MREIYLKLRYYWYDEIYWKSINFKDKKLIYNNYIRYLFLNSPTVINQFKKHKPAMFHDEFDKIIINKFFFL